MTDDSKDIRKMQRLDAKSAETAREMAVTTQLKAYFDAITEEGIPDRFVELLDKLDKAEQATKDRSYRDDK